MLVITLNSEKEGYSMEKAEFQNQQNKSELADLRTKFQEYKEAEIKNGNEFLVKDINSDELDECVLKIFFKYTDGSLSHEELNAYTKKLYPMTASEAFRKVKNNELSLGQLGKLVERTLVNRSVEELRALIINKCSSPEWRARWKDKKKKDGEVA